MAKTTVKERDKIICLDFDGTVHGSQDWKDGRPEGEPTDGAKEFIQEMLDEGYEVIISSARINEGIDMGEIINGIVDWMEEYSFPYGIAVTGEKPAAQYYVDDRAIRFNGNWDNVRTRMSDPNWLE